MSKTTRIISLVIIDAVLLNLSVFIALLMKYDAAVPQQYIENLQGYAIIATIVQLAVFWIFGLYKSLWEYASIEELVQIVFATMVATAIGSVTGFFTGRSLPVSVYIVGWASGKLAETGGVAAEVFYAAGGLFIVAAGVLAAARKK